MLASMGGGGSADMLLVIGLQVCSIVFQKLKNWVPRDLIIWTYI